MIKVYADWSVMSQMKQGHHPELLAMLERKHQVHVFYSTSHISDILVSYNGDSEQDARIKEDLDFISKLTGKLCVYTAEKEVVTGERDPHELFADRVSEREGYGKDGPLAHALQLLEPGTAAYEAMQAYINSPLPKDIADVLQNQATAASMRDHYPGLEENPTLGNFMKIIWMNNRNLQETDAYKNLRLTVQGGLGIKKDKMFATPKPFAELDKVYQKVTALSGFNIENVLRNDNSPQWFQDISHNYLMLDLHGYQQDKVKVDEKNKETMRNTIDDGFHAAFASTCDCYVTNDTKATNKAKQVYEKLGINTRIYTPQEFVADANDSLVYDDPRTHLNLWMRLLNTDNYVESEVDGAIWRTIRTAFFFFDYFNKTYMVYTPESDLPMVLLSKDKPTNYRFTTQADVTAVINKINTALEKTGDDWIDPENLDFKKVPICEWPYRGANFRLQFSNGFLQLYMDMPNGEPENEDGKPA